MRESENSHFVMCNLNEPEIALSDSVERVQLMETSIQTIPSDVADLNIRPMHSIHSLYESQSQSYSLFQFYLKSLSDSLTEGYR